jgi:hypothetical protein
MNRVQGLSKSRIMSSLQCLKRVHLEVNCPELVRYSKKTKAAFRLGHEVGDRAIELYGGQSGVYVDFDGRDLAGALTQTRELLNGGYHGPVFEATLQYEGVLVREDVLLPDDEGWRVVEVKASTRVKDEYLHDCAIQAWVHLGAGYPLNGIALAHVDNGFVYPGNGDYDGLLVENDLSEPVRDLLPAVPVWVENAREAVAGPEPHVPVGQHCMSPYECPFIDHCWPGDSRYPIRGLGGSRKKLGTWVMDGYRDIREVPSSEISSETQLRIHRVTVEGRAELLPGARRFVDALDYPRFYLDFETVAPPVPRWPGTRPYEVLPFQWSCHVERAPGDLQHVAFLDLEAQPPMRPLAEALIEALERDGPVLMYTTYELGVLRGLAGRFPDLSDALNAVIGRLVDLQPVTKANYYHPDMLGSWSIKAVLPTIAPDLDYAKLEGIQEGTAASDAYLEAIEPDTAPTRRKQIRDELLTYCRQDTEAMVRLVHFFAGYPLAP